MHRAGSAQRTQPPRPRCHSSFDSVTLDSSPPPLRLAFHPPSTITVLLSFSLPYFPPTLYFRLPTSDRRAKIPYLVPGIRVQTFRDSFTLLSPVGIYNVTHFVKREGRISLPLSLYRRRLSIDRATDFRERKAGVRRCTKYG